MWNFESLARILTEWLGTPPATIIAFGIVGAWLTGAFFIGFTDVWMLVINTITTIITFLMVFILQATQNRDSKATQAKLDELIEAQQDAPDRLVGADEDMRVEDLSHIRETQRLDAKKESGRGE